MPGQGGKRRTPGQQGRSPEGAGRWSPLPAAACPFPYAFPSPSHPEPGPEHVLAHSVRADAAWCHQLSSSRSAGWAGGMADLHACLSPPGVCLAGWLSAIPALPACFWLWAPSQPEPGSSRQRVCPCPRDRARMLSAFMVMFGFLIALPNRSRKKRAEPRLGVFYSFLSCGRAPASPSPGSSTVPQWGRGGAGVQGLDVTAL